MDGIREASKEGRKEARLVRRKGSKDEERGTGRRDEDVCWI